MNKVLKSLVVIASLLFLAGCEEPLSESDEILQNAYDNKTSGLQVEGSGEVTRLLADDTEGDKHQRFIVTLDSGQTLLIAHNIDIAPRIDVIATGNRIEFYGVYEWNDEGGVIHWTHHDPAGKHVDGWLKYKGETYE
ncbi:DUF3465 domain-containing protein [Reinekea marina]|uniref:DUF3465 domain-containing protein n=1 Tax=Reinekea marina TaxID=1310421 RepID=A0ABV7WS25_9GAMM|nr:DUF3465 domain-containing protein [Reinekea marina]MDN3647566.1 DUF3465 domain-containing protein [Reinekea marina]